MELNIYSKTLKSLVVLLTISMMVSSCSLLGGKTKQIEIMAKPIERTIVQPIMPREIDLKEPMWYAVTEANIDAFLIDIKEEHGEIVFLAM